jgi:hypothetical protein
MEGVSPKYLEGKTFFNIICLCGRIGSGKDYFADQFEKYIDRKDENIRVIKLSFAEKLKEDCKISDPNYKELSPFQFRRKIREFASRDPTIYVEDLKKRLLNIYFKEYNIFEDHKFYIVITDVRTKGQMKMLKSLTTHRIKKIFIHLTSPYSNIKTYKEAEGDIKKIIELEDHHTEKNILSNLKDVMENNYIGYYNSKLNNIEDFFYTITNLLK